MIRHLLRTLTGLTLYLLLCGQAFTPAYAAPALHMQVEVSRDVLTCTASPVTAPEGLERALKEGSAINVSWKISIEVARKYWLNKSIAGIEVKRRVMPDLVSQTWLLVDETSGITRRVFSLSEAADFLTRLQSFPVVDRSLLMVGQAYVVKVSINKREGDAKERWWDTWFGGDTSQASTEFTLP